MFTKSEMLKVQNYLQKLFKTTDLFLKESNSNDAPAELYKGSEFLGVIYKNDEEGEVSYDFNMSILGEDL